jgi:hypothetical protein
MNHFKAPHDLFVNAKRYDTYLEDVEIPEPDNLFSPPAGSVASKGKGSSIGRTHAPWGLALHLVQAAIPLSRLFVDPVMLPERPSSAPEWAVLVPHRDL